MSETLYRKYRPQYFSELVGQEHITKTLQKALEKERTAQAYLFCGPKGTGKTTTARILAKALNCLENKETKKQRNKETRKQEIKGITGFEPCGYCEHCQAIAEGNFLDLIEIDAASNRGIDEIRELKEKVNYPPTLGKYKIYIIDEVHMLTTEAANALLKTLEEPPQHVIFILCTTEPHKILLTVISRCQRFDFQRASLKNIVSRLEQILVKEEISSSKEALLKIAENASGGFRDAEGLLSKLLSLNEEKSISEQKVETVLGLVEEKTIFSLLDDIQHSKIEKSLYTVNHLQEKGGDLNGIVKKMIESLRSMLLVKSGLGQELLEISAEQYEKLQKTVSNWSTEEINILISRLVEIKKEMKQAVVLSLPLEMLIVESALKDKGKENENNIQKIEIKNQKREEIITKQDIKPQIFVHSIQSNQEVNSKLLSEIVLKWQDILKNVKPRNHSIEALLKACRPIVVMGNTLHLEFFYPFHKERIETPKARDIVEEVISSTINQSIQIKCILGHKGKGNKENKEAASLKINNNKQEELMKAAQEIFQGEMIK